MQQPIHHTFTTTNNFANEDSNTISPTNNMHIVHSGHHSVTNKPTMNKCNNLGLSTYHQLPSNTMPKNKGSITPIQLKTITNDHYKPPITIHLQAKTGQKNTNNPISL